ncbi:MAG: integration host factor subunit beta [Treponema sp.]|nr:integration host factor subunit beta [Treponema sp.]
MEIKKVTKNDLVDSIYQNKELKVEKQNVQKVVDALLTEIKKSLGQGSTIELRGFGTFEPRLRKAKSQARNPKTGEKVKVDAHYVAAFRAGLELKETLWNLKKQ